MDRLPYDTVDEETGAIRIVPLMFSVGNHDLGVNSGWDHHMPFNKDNSADFTDSDNSKISATQRSLDHQERNDTNWSNIPHDNTRPVFKHFFPQNTVTNTKNGLTEVAGIHNRMSYFAHKIGREILFLSLDTGYEVPIALQVDFIEEQMSDQYKHIFVQYHHPMYSACTKGEKHGIADEGRKHWVPLFEKYKVSMVFENHVHGFKITHPIKEGKINKEEGVVYIGDGSWGPLVSD